MAVIIRLCKVFRCNIGDIVEVVPEKCAVLFMGHNDC
ncbi:MAG: helix-turn-helix domain-containing protein [Agathobacter sp.]